MRMLSLWMGLQSYQQSMEDTEQEAYLREDLTGIAFDISQSNFNVRQFKKSHGVKPIRPANQHPHARTVSRLFTEPNHTNPSQLDNNSITHQSKTMSQGLHKALKYNDNFITPVTKNRQNKFFGKANAKYASQITKSAEQIQLPSAKKKFTGTERTSGGSLAKYQKEWSRGRIKQKCIEEWLNAVLIEYCHDEYFDRNIANCALKKLGVDENSLVAKGFQPKNVTRLYRGLFVFGMGFNELISELANGNMEVTKIVWRIYSMILQYCSKGGMETVIGEMHRDNAIKVNELSNEIAKRQEIIEKNEELNEHKNNEIYREIKRLREENINLTNQKTVLSQEYSATQQAFGEEVGLRLKFQTRINQIYGLHRELGIKHHKLFEQFGTKVEQLRKEAEKYFQVASKTQQLKETGLKLREELILLREKSKRQGEYIRQINKERVELKDAHNKLEFEIIQSKSRISQLRNKSKQSEKEIANLMAMLQLRQKSSKETHRQYQITLQENNRLYIQLSDQRKVMQEYEKEKNNFNSKIISIVSQNSFNKRKLQELQNRYDALDENYKEALKKIDTLLLEDEIKTKSEENYKSYYVNSQQNISEMHRINISNEEELAFLRKYHRNMQKVLNEKKETTNKLKNQAETASAQAEKYKFQLDELQSNYRVLQNQNETNGRMLVVKQQKLDVQRQKHEQKITSLQKEMASQNEELNVLRSNVDTIMTHLKNQKFERSTLNSSYIQSLKMIQSKNVTERNLNVKISLLEGEIDREKNRYQILEKNMVILISDFGALQERLEATLDKQRKILQQKKDYRNPMIFEDMQAQIHRHIDVNNELRSKIAFLQMQLQKQIQLARQNLQKTVQSYRWQINKLTKEFQKLQQIKTNELQFQKQQYKAQKIRLQQLEEVSESYRKKIHERSSSEREEVYKFMLEEKKKQIENQFAEMEKLQDELSKSKKEIAEINATYEQDYMNKYGDQAGKSSQELRKELEHEYDLKFRELQRSMRSQYTKKQQNWKEESQNYIKSISLQEILRLKDIKIDSAIQELSQYNEGGHSGGSFLNREHLQKRDLIRYKTDTKKRKQMGRILKNAFEYYQI